MTAHHLHKYTCPLCDDSDLVVEMHGEQVPDTISYGTVWDWEPMRSFVDCGGVLREASPELERMVSAWWRELPGLPEAIQRWQRGER